MNCSAALQLTQFCIIAYFLTFFFPYSHIFSLSSLPLLLSAPQLFLSTPLFFPYCSRFNHPLQFTAKPCFILFYGFCFSSFCDNIRTYLVTLFLLLFGVSVQAQKTVTGYVTDSISGEPVSYASVYVKSTGTGTRSDDDGRFVLKRPSVSTEIVISAIGYVEKTVKLTSGSNTTLQIQMRPADYQLK